MLSYIRKLFSWSILILSAHILHAQTGGSDLDYGLSFASHEVTKDQRTSLSLNPQEPFTIQEDFEVRFDLSFQRLINAYGYVLRIIANDSVNIDLVSSPEHADFSDFNLIINNERTNVHYEYSDVDLKPLQWTSVILAFSPKTNQITLSWNGKKKTQSFPVSGLRTYRLFFGANNFGKFNTSDVPPMSLRNINIVKKNESFVQWNLKNHSIDEVYDNAHEQIATVKNPIWLIDRHIKWVHRKEFPIGKYPSIAFDSRTGTLYATDIDAVYTLDIRSGKLGKEDVKEGNSIYTDANQLVYIEETGKLVNYDYFTNKHSVYNTAQKSWQNKDTVYHEPNYWHNNKFYNHFDSSLYMFGGYGFFSYKNAFFKYDAPAGQWQKVETEGSIPPRYLGASGLTSARTKALIFGGYGSMSGKQELSPQSFYDLYSFDLKSHEVKKMWEFQSHDAEDVVFSNSLVTNEKDSCFYVLSFPKNKYESYIKLRGYALATPETIGLADSIPFRFHDEHSFCDLFLSKATKELIAVTVHKENEQYKVHVYSINYPPLNVHDVLQPDKISYANVVWYGLLFIGLAGVIGIYVLIRRKKKHATKTIAVVEKETPSIPATAQDTVFANDLPEEKPVSTINLFGGFQVFDKTGHDITGKFTTTLKELFVMILLHSVKFEKGISTTVLQENLWPDKDETSARNNRNVNIKKLRTLLEEIGDITIENNNSYLHLVISSTVFCDYQTAYKVLDTGNMERQKIEILLKYVKRGSLLPNLQTAWLDSFKSDISNKIIDVLLAYSAQLDIHKDDKILLEIADAIFNYDTINQEAMVLKCSVLNKKGKHSLAKNWYDHFVKEYKNLYGENYPKTFDEVVS